MYSAEKIRNDSNEDNKLVYFVCHIVFCKSVNLA